MARSIRFVPTLRGSSSYQKFTEPARLLHVPPVSNSPPATVPVSVSPIEQPINLSDHVENLVRSAVCQPTVLPPVYVLQESIGDRISRLREPEPPKPSPVVISPKIPAPDPNWTPTTPSEMTAKYQPETIEPGTIKPETIKPEPVASLEESPQPIEFSATEPSAIASFTTEPSAAEIVPDSPEIVPDSPETVSEWLGTMANYMEQVTQELEDLPSHKAPVKVTTCPQCGSDNVRKNGRRSNKQKYACKDCGRQFTSAICLEPNPPLLKTSRSTAKSSKKPEAFVASSKPTKKLKTATKKQSRGFGT
ncbi:hypothetical protein C7B61_08800 [filamentous cyanobacterium CCP1]|nr:hypothetical protein C7B76_28025 [filamentous cyanobacterium CCP2]PSB66932.1 hypothetical protein C7B61_08800 [filamentous cyanobacterium CCP1]